MASYRVDITGDAHAEIRRVPGNMRQRVIRTLHGLATQPRPSSSRALDTTRAGFVQESGVELRRLRLEAWRIVYAVEDAAHLVSILAVRRRPPDRYDELQELIDEL